MKYEPIKKSLGNVFNKHPFLRILFYKLLDLLLLRAWHIKRELKTIRKSIGNKASVLDAGSGFGQYTYYISTLSDNWTVKGVDIKEEQMLDCNNFFGKIGRGNRVKFETADLTRFSDVNEYNFILSVDVMEHIGDDIQVFKNFYHSLKQGGMLLISTPSDQGGSDVHDEEEESFIAEHVRDGYNILDIQEKLKFAGFSKVDVKFSYGTPGQISWKLSMKYPIIMLNASKLFFVLLPFYYILTYPFCLVLNYFDTVVKHKTGTGLIVKAWK
jgi:SAM-dependent methyltransferase